MKEIKIIIINLLVYFLPFWYLQIHDFPESTKVEYATFENIYMWFVVILLLVSWGIVSNIITRWLVGKTDPAKS